MKIKPNEPSLWKPGMRYNWSKLPSLLRPGWIADTNADCTATYKNFVKKWEGSESQKYFESSLKEHEESMKTDKSLSDNDKPVMDKITGDNI